MRISPQAQRILLRAAEYLKDPSHWLKGKLRDGATYRVSTRVCALGSLRKACIEEGLAKESELFNVKLEPYLEARDALREASDPPVIPYWNDHPNTSHAEVHSAFCKAVKEHATDPDLLDQETADKTD